jgi:hypothetical protein
MPISIEMKPAAAAAGSKDRVFSFDLSSEQPIVVIAGNGAFLCSWGIEWFPIPHAIRTKDPVAIAQSATLCAWIKQGRGLRIDLHRRTRSRTMSSPSRPPSTIRERSRSANGVVML